MTKYLSEEKDFIVASEPGVWHIIPIKRFRETISVNFDKFPFFNQINGLDIVRHEAGANSPSLPNGDTDVWYMHKGQEDNLITIYGNRIIELYNPNSKKIEIFEISYDCIKLNGKTIHYGPAILGWSKGVFHRNHSSGGSVSQNFAVRDDEFDVDTEFNIYRLETETGNYSLERVGKEDQAV